MNLIEVFLVHNRPWSKEHIFWFSIVFAVVSTGVIRRLITRRICWIQALAVWLLTIYLGIVFMSTVFTRNPGSEITVQLMPFWSWRAALQGDTGIASEIFMNILLFMPVGGLFSLAAGRKVKLAHALWCGLIVSVGIELQQLILRRGLFEWDDMMHNTLGSVIGAWVVNQLYRIQTRLLKW